MTRLIQLLVPTITTGIVWLALILGMTPVSLSDSSWYLILPLPLYCAVLLGFYALATVSYSVYCVRSDDGALEHLQKDIKNAKEDLKRKGFQFDS